MARTLGTNSDQDYQRPLGGSEELFYNLSRVHPITIVLAAEVRGESNADQWRSAIDAVAAHRPMVRARVSSSPSSRPYFHLTEERAPLEFLEFDQVDVADYCRRELMMACDPTVAPWRFTVLLGERLSTLIVAADHAVIDGRGLVLLVRDIMETMSGRSLRAGMHISPSHDELLGIALPAIYKQTTSVVTTPNSLPAPQEPLEIEYETIEVELLGRMKAISRTNETTLHGALVAAALISGCSLSEGWKQDAVRYISPVDNRPILARPDYFGLCITFTHGTSETPDLSDFWSLARKIRHEIKQNLPISRSRETMSGLLSAFEDPAAAGNSPAMLPPWDLMVTNYGNLSIPSSYGDLQLVGLTPHVRTRLFAQTVSIATFNDTLRMSNASHALIPGLLGKMKSVLGEIAP